MTDIYKRFPSFFALSLTQSHQTNKQHSLFFGNISIYCRASHTGNFAMSQPTTSVSSATAETAHDVASPSTQSVASANTQQTEQEKEEKEKEAERLYEERIEEEYAKREGGA